MLLLAHILIALSSLGFTTHLYFSSTKVKFKVAYGLIGGTLASGTALVIATHSPMLSSCITGLAYLGAVSFGLFVAHRKFASEYSRTE